MPMPECRLCHHPLLQPELLCLPNMPARAQFFSAVPQSGESVDLRLWQCSACGVVQLSNEPVSYYREVVRAAAYSADMREFRRRQLRSWADAYALHGCPVLEVGCGRGEYLELLQEAGMLPFGIEGGAEAVQEVRRRGLAAETLFLDDPGIRLAQGPFAAFACFNYLEHIPDLPAWLGAVRGNLAPGGVGLVEVPNFDMILRHQHLAEIVLDHLYYFTAESLERMLQMHGFEVLRCRPLWSDYILSAEIRVRPRLDLSGMQQGLARLRSELLAFVGNQVTAVWGAGHQALAAIALSGLAGRLCYVIDSAPFKQNCYTPGSNLPIVGPDVLRDTPPDAIIVMAGGYSDEIATRIRQDYPGRFRVAIWREHRLEMIHD